jgi:hypothetical protein
MRFVRAVVLAIFVFRESGCTTGDSMSDGSGSGRNANSITATDARQALVQLVESGELERGVAELVGSQETTKKLLAELTSDDSMRALREDEPFMLPKQEGGFGEWSEESVDLTVLGEWLCDLGRLRFQAYLVSVVGHHNFIEGRFECHGDGKWTARLTKYERTFQRRR